MNTRNNRWIVERMCLCTLLLLLGNKSIMTFPRQRIIVECAVFYAVRIVSEERKWVTLPRISFLVYFTTICVCYFRTACVLFYLIWTEYQGLERRATEYLGHIFQHYPRICLGWVRVTTDVHNQSILVVFPRDMLNTKQGYSCSVFCSNSGMNSECDIPRMFNVHTECYANPMMQKCIFGENTNTGMIKS
jgi:hypothetical protein